MACKIRKIDFYFPEGELDNAALARIFPGFSEKKIESKIGIRSRHIAAETETALDMGFAAAEKVLRDYDKNRIDFLLFCTQSPDYILPTGACILQDRLGLSKKIGALDYNLGCSGYIYGLALAKGLISAGIATNVLLVTAETYSKHIHPSDKGNRSIFGDAAAATIIEKSEQENIFEFALGTDGSGAGNLIIRNGMMRSQKDGSENDFLFMDGPEIFNFTIEALPLLIEETLRKNNLTMDDLDYVIFHQANKYMLGYLQMKMEIPPEKFFNNMLDSGNTVSATIPIAMKQAIEQNLIKPGSRILLAGFGVGYSYGATVITL